MASKLLKLDSLIEQIESIGDLSSPSRSEGSLVKMGNWSNDAGGRVLDHFEKRWESVHRGSVENSHMAERVASSISGIVSRVDRERQVLADVEMNLSELTGSDSVIHTLQTTLDHLLINVKVIQEFLHQTEDVTLNLNMHKALDIHYHLNIYEGRMRKESSARIRIIHSDHAQRMKELEKEKVKRIKEKVKREEEERKREEELLRERQRTFSEAFHSEIDQYKRQGVINSPVSPPLSATSLSDVVLQVDEEEKRMLELFLQDEED